MRAILGRSSRGELEPQQLSWLDKGAGPADAQGLELYCAGELALTERRAISVIGTRNVSELGALRATKFARELAQAGVVVVSGLAAGVDTVALQSAIHHGGSVIAVIGTPIDKAYPAQNAGLQQEIYRHHLLVSQFAPGTRTFPSHFPERNRTMAAMSDASVIIEASESSGTLHQAAECIKLNRWLAISKSVVDDPELKWPAKFLDYPRCVVLQSTADLLARVYEN